jgi:hypothetical protein
MSRHRNVCWTLNNPTDDEIQSLIIENPRIRYMVIGHEVGENGTPHLQGYLEMCNPTVFSTLKNLIGHRAHIEERNGTSKQASGYCKKGTDEAEDYSIFFPRTREDPGTWSYVCEYGQISSQGKRTDLTPAVELLANGSSIVSVAKQHPEIFVRYHRGLRDLRASYLLPRNLPDNPQVVVLWGDTGTGKTRDAILHYSPDEEHYVFRPSNGNWWDGYDGQKKVILEEFRGSMPWADLLGLLDRNEYRAPVKGGFVQIQADKFIITSPCPPETWYKSDDRYDKYSQLERRITEVHHYTHG